MSTLQPKVEVNTSTDLHLDLLADPTKIKPQKKNINLTHITESDDDDSHIVNDLQKDNSKLSDDKSSRKSSKSSKSSDYSKSSSRSSVTKSDKPSPKNLVTNKPILLPNVIPPKPPASNPPSFFANLFGGNMGSNTNNTSNISNTNNTNNTSNTTNTSNIPAKDNYATLSEEQKRIKRLQKFAELKYIKDTYKVQLTKEFSYNSDYYEMAAEIEFHRSNISKKNSVEFFKSMVFGSVGMVDKLNKMLEELNKKILIFETLNKKKLLNEINEEKYKLEQLEIKLYSYQTSNIILNGNGNIFKSSDDLKNYKGKTLEIVWDNVVVKVNVL